MTVPVNASSDTSSRSAQRSRVSLGIFCAVQALLVLGAAAYGMQRYQAIIAPRVLPIPSNEPLAIGPLYDRPDVISDDQLVTILDQLKPRLRGRQPKINHIDHALRFWGVEAMFDDPECLSGVEMRELLLDHRAFSEAWGSDVRPFLIPDTSSDADLISFRTMAGPASASHYDHTIAGLAEVGTPLDYPVITPIGERPLRAAVDYSLKMFSLNQGEYEWSTLAFLHYLSHESSWFSTEGQEITWDRLAERLMRQRLAQGVCYGNHRLHALVLLLRVDDEVNQILSPDMRSQIVAHLQDATARLVKSQHADGYWDGRWPGEEWDGPQPADVRGPFGPTADRLLATGHALEWWALAPPEVHPPRETVARAGQWVCASVGELSESQLSTYYPFLTHAGRALALWRGKFPHEVELPQSTTGPEAIETAAATTPDAPAEETEN